MPIIKDMVGGIQMMLVLGIGKQRNTALEYLIKTSVERQPTWAVTWAVCPAFSPDQHSLVLHVYFSSFRLGRQQHEAHQVGTQVRVGGGTSAFGRNGF
jgi:hypothetical protein